MKETRAIISCILTDTQEHCLGVISIDIQAEIKKILQQSWENKQQGFGNARYVRNIFQEIIQNQAMRLSDNDERPDREQLKRITVEDLP